MAGETFIDKEGRERPTIFHEPKYQYLADLVCQRNPHCAMGSAEDLEEEFDMAQTRAKKVRIIDAVNEASKRANAQLKRKELSSKERAEFKQIERTYRALRMRLSGKLPPP